MLAVHIIPLDHIDVPKDEVIPPLEDLIVQALKESARYRLRKDTDRQCKHRAEGRQERPAAAAGHHWRPYQQRSCRERQPIAAVGGSRELINPPSILHLSAARVRCFHRSLTGTIRITALVFNSQFRYAIEIAKADLVRDSLQLRQAEVRLRINVNQVRVDVENARLALERSRASYDAAVETVSLQEEALASRAGTSRGGAVNFL